MNVRGADEVDPCDDVCPIGLLLCLDKPEAPGGGLNDKDSDGPIPLKSVFVGLMTAVLDVRVTVVSACRTFAGIITALPSARVIVPPAGPIVCVPLLIGFYSDR
jgi:hypothetical protein